MPYTTDNEDKQFGNFFLGDIINYVADNFNPSEVFGDDELKEWIADSYEPDEVVNADRLKEWALNNGYVEEDDAEGA